MFHDSPNLSQFQHDEAQQTHMLGDIVVIAMRVIVKSREFRDTGGNYGNDAVRGRHINYWARACATEISNSSIWASHTGSNPGLEDASYGWLHFRGISCETKFFFPFGAIVTSEICTLCKCYTLALEVALIILLIQDGLNYIVMISPLPDCSRWIAYLYLPSW